MREKNTYITTSKYVATPKQKSKPLMSADERKRQAKSLVTYRPGGNDPA